MSNIDESLKTIAERVKNHSETMQTEEAVKTAVVLPFLRALGYDVFNPLEVIPEFTADTIGKKGEKVDYALCVDNEIRILFECKPISTDLNPKHLSQLYRYFSVTSAKFAVLTNGRLFHFYTDLDALNKLDNLPFLTFDITEYNTAVLTELKKFERSTFNVDNILATAERLKYVSAIKQFILKEMDAPSDELVKLISKEVYEGRYKPSMLDMFKSVTKSAFREVISDAVKNRLSSALQTTTEADEKDVKDNLSQPVEDIITTEEEIEAYMIVKSIVREVISAERIFMRDFKSCCLILVDDNARRPLVRLHFNRKIKQIGLLDNQQEEKFDIANLDAIYDYADRIRDTAKKYIDQ